MMSEERVREEITKLEEAKMTIFAQLKQTEGALAAMQFVLDPVEPEAVSEPDAEEE